MKTCILVAAALFGLAGSALASEVKASVPATSSPIVRMDPYEVTSSAPKLVRILEPRLPLEFAGRELNLEFWVDRDGRPYNIDADTRNLPDRYTNVHTASLVTRLADAIQGWEFRPAFDAQGLPVERKVILPIRIQAES
jgi:hypothetical protein